MIKPHTPTEFLAWAFIVWLIVFFSLIAMSILPYFVIQTIQGWSQVSCTLGGDQWSYLDDECVNRLPL